VVLARYSAATDSWGSVTQLSASGQSALDPRVAVAPGGDTVIVWNGANRIYALYFDSSTSLWNGPTMVSGDVTTYGPSGSGGPSVLRAARFQAATGVWGGSADVTPVSGRGVSGRYLPELATDPGGNVYCVWAEGWLSIPDLIRVAKYSVSTGTWQPSDLTAPTTSAGVVGYPGIAIDANGRITVAWLFNHTIQATRYALPVESVTVGAHPQRIRSGSPSGLASSRGLAVASNADAMARGGKPCAVHADRL
jgi:hypothetical protein